jgi:hypothetical protein
MAGRLEGDLALNTLVKLRERPGQPAYAVAGGVLNQPVKQDPTNLKFERFAYTTKATVRIADQSFDDLPLRRRPHTIRPTVA